MPLDDLFGREEETLQEGQRVVAEGLLDTDADKARYEGLLKEYGRLFRTTRRLMRLSDRNERELASMAEKQRHAAEQIAKKNKELEALSTKLAKYLSPQVYASIFSGQQEVQLASQRKKLTIFFSDIAGFTEITDKMESEDLTHLLNQYLTEMAGVALEHGATVDKYVGDAIMIFFGDPETRGVKEDALSCVRMAIAMQKRTRELGHLWRDMGFEQRLRSRIGIHTGYCTVGNFGSNDRMDYTIIGGAVNLASRLEHEAPAGGILISYETYAHVKDEVFCEPQGEIRVRGMAYPVAIFRVIDLMTNIEPARRTIREHNKHFRLELDAASMSEDEREASVLALEQALRTLEARRPTANSSRPLEPATDSEAG